MRSPLCVLMRRKTCGRALWPLNQGTGHIHEAPPTWPTDLPTPTSKCHHLGELGLINTWIWGGIDIQSMAPSFPYLPPASPEHAALRSVVTVTHVSVSCAVPCPSLILPYFLNWTQSLFLCALWSLHLPSDFQLIAFCFLERAITFIYDTR